MHRVEMDGVMTTGSLPKPSSSVRWKKNFLYVCFYIPQKSMGESAVQ